MAGAIQVSDSTTWTAASWLFDWVIRTLAECESPAVRNRAAEIEGSQVRFLSLPDLPSEELREVVRFLRQVIPEKAQGSLAAVLAEPDQPVKIDTPATMDLIQSLADLVAASYP